jgi:hypothetical protein
MIAAWSCMLFLINGSHTSKNILWLLEVYQYF